MPQNSVKLHLVFTISQNLVKHLNIEKILSKLVLSNRQRDFLCIYPFFEITSDNHVTIYRGWATLISYYINQGPIPEIFAKKYWELVDDGRVENLRFFESAILNWTKFWWLPWFPAKSKGYIKLCSIKRVNSKIILTAVNKTFTFHNIVHTCFRRMKCAKTPSNYI